MDRPISILNLESVEKKNPFPLPDVIDDEIWGDDVSYYIDPATELDNKDEFVKIVDKLELEEHLLDACSAIYKHDAVECAAAILAQETDRINLSFGLSGAGWTPLHEIARNASIRLAALFLEKGFSADARSICDYMDIKKPLPLNVALRSLRDHDFIKLWASSCNGKKRAIRLLVELCSIHTRHYLEIVRVLAKNTKEVKNEFLNYLKDGKMVEVGALLLVAGKDLLPLSLPTPQGKEFVMDSIKGMHDFLFAKKREFEASGCLCPDELAELEGTLVLLNILDRIGEKLFTYIRLSPIDDVLLPGAGTVKAERQSHLEVASLIRSAGFDVTAGDTYGPVSFNSKPFEEMVLNGRPRLTYYSSHPLEFDFASHMTGGTKRNMRLVGKMRGLEALACRSFHNFSAPKLDSYLGPSTPAMRLVNMVLQLNPCKKTKWSFFAAALKKGLRHV